MDSLVAAPTFLPNVGCDALGTCWLRFLTLDDLPSLEGIRDILGKQQLELRQILKPTRSGASKGNPGHRPAGLALVGEASTVTLAEGCSSCRSKASTA